MVSRYPSDQVLRSLTSGYAFTLGGGADSWRSGKHKSEVDSSTKAEYVAASELGVGPDTVRSIVLFRDNNGAVGNSKEPRYTKGLRHVEWKFHLGREIEAREDIVVTRVTSSQDLANSSHKDLTSKGL
jgi:hypothetical protein